LLDALMSDASLTSRQIAFHGGTSLHFSWRSPRRSEDLDFLVTAQMETYVRDALENVANAIEKNEFGASLKRIRP